jgi:hypothetical protein
MAKLTAWREEPPSFIVSSSKTKSGRMEILKAIEAYLTTQA